MGVSVSVLYFPGTNCHEETLRAFRKVGATPRLVMLQDALRGEDQIDRSDILVLPGGFAFGDHVSAGFVAAALLRHPLKESFERCLTRPMLCICNGFQVAIKAGVFGDGCDLVVNQHGTFRHVTRQPHQVVGEGAWLGPLSGTELRFPCAHGEGQFVYRDRSGWKPALVYPDGQNPDGSQDNVAGITTPDGLKLGMMNHPERALQLGQNLELFRAGVAFAQG